MGRSGTQGFEFKFGKNWNFNLSNFCTVITRPRPLKICQSVRVLNTYPGHGQVCAVGVHPLLSAVGVHLTAHGVQATRGSTVLTIQQNAQKLYKKVVHFDENNFAKSIDSEVKQAYNKGIETKRGTTPERGIHYD